MADTVDILTTLQRAFLCAFGATELRKEFFLTGGTALAHFYLKHRFSEDLDFFTEIPGAVSRVRPVLAAIATDLELDVEVHREFESFLEVFLSKGRESIRCDFALQSPFRLQPVTMNEEFGILVDNLLDIACNKLSALFDRHEAKDFVDVYFLSEEFMPFDELFSNAQKKHVGMDEYWMARALENVFSIEKLPRMIKPIEVATLRVFFERQIASLVQRMAAKEGSASK